MKRIFAACLAVYMLVALGLPATAYGAEAEVRKSLEAKIGKPEALTKAPLAGLWEAIVDGQVYYIDDNAKFILVGNLIELKSGRNLTAERQFAMFPLNLAIKQVKGKGKNIIVTFEDPNCGYCKKLGKDLQKLKNATIYTFLYPVLGEDSLEKAKAIWCSSDKAKVWVDWMTTGKPLASAPENCDVAGLRASTDLGHKLRISGTPALFFGNGDRVGGYIPIEEIEKRFDELSG